MPLQEYKCECGETIERIEKFSDAPLEKCPKCAGKVERQIGRTSFALKGGGWSADGYAAKEH